LNKIAGIVILFRDFVNEDRIEMTARWDAKKQSYCLTNPESPDERRKCYQVIFGDSTYFLVGTKNTLCSSSKP